MKVKDILSFIDSVAPFDTQESWDNSGFLIGDPEAEVTKAALSLDVTIETVGLATQAGAQLLISHHPVIFEARTWLHPGDPAYEAVRAGLSVICAHTCLDSAEGGVNDVLAKLIGLENVRPLPLEGTCVPMVRVGETEKPLTAKELALRVKAAVGGRLAVAAGTDEIKTVAVCGGAGGSLAKEIRGKADALVTGELKHHNLLFAHDAGMTLIAAGHFETEAPVMTALYEKLKENFKQIDFELLKVSSPAIYY